MRNYLPFFLLLLLVSRPARAQVIYKDANPDVFIETNGTGSNTINLDLDSNGVIDFSAYCYWAHPSNMMYEAEPRLFSTIDSNIVMYDSLNGAAYAAMLQTGHSVGAGPYWQDPSLNSYMTLQYDGQNPGAFYFIGVRFLIGSQHHYGWIRVKTYDFTANYTAYCNLVIYDWAYEAQPDSMIMIGEGWNAVPETSNTTANVFAADHRVCIQPNGNSAMHVTVFDAFGKKVAEEENLQGNSSIDLPGAAEGIYLVKVEADEKVFTQKIYLR